MPKIKSIKAESSIILFGKYLSIKEWRKLKKHYVGYINNIKSNSNDKKSQV